MKIKPHQFPHLADGVKRMRSAADIAKEIWEHPDICLRGSMFSYPFIMVPNKDYSTFMNWGIEVKNASDQIFQLSTQNI